MHELLRKMLAMIFCLTVAVAPDMVFPADPVTSVSAVDVATAAPNQLRADLEALKPHYSGENPGELLAVLEQILVQWRQLTSENELALDAGLDRDAAGEAYQECIALIMDMLVEWPGPALARAVRKGLTTGKSEFLEAALRASEACASSVEKELCSLAANRDAEMPHRVLAVLALAHADGERSERLLQRLEGLEEAPLRNSAMKALSFRHPQTQPPSDQDIETVMVGKSLLRDFRLLPLVDVGADSPQVVIMNELSGRAFSKELLETCERVLSESGTVVVVRASRSQNTWPASFKTWCASIGVKPPTGEQAYRSRGRISYGEYRSLVDFPFPLRDQPGRAAERAWSSWDSATQAAPVRTLDGSAALVVVQNDVLGNGGRMLFTTVDLRSHPIYRGNILRWVYGNSLLAYSGWQSEYECREGGRTPHVPWGRPIEGKSPKLLYLTSAGWRRSLLELRQRLEADVRYVPYMASMSRPPTAKDDKPPSRMSQLAIEKLRRLLSWPDAIIFDCGLQNLIRSMTRSIPGPVSFDTVPSDLQRLMYRRVHLNGMALIGTSDPRAGGSSLERFVSRLNNGREEREVPPFDSELMQPLRKADESSRLVTIGRRGKGRLGWFAHRFAHVHDEPSRPPEGSLYRVPGLFGPAHPIRADEYTWGTLARTVLTAVSGNDRPRIQEVRCERSRAGKSLSVIVELDQAVEGKLQVWSRDAFDRTTPVQETPISGPGKTVKIGSLSAGSHVVELQLVNEDGEVLDFAAIPVTVEGEVTIAAVRTGEKYFDPGEKIPVKIQLNAPFSGTVRVEARDTYGRTTFMRVLRQKSDIPEYALDVPIRYPLSRLWDIIVTLERNGEVLDRYRRPIGIVLSPPERDFVVTAPVSGRALVRFFKEKLGVDVSYGTKEWLVRNNFEFSSGAWSDSIGASVTPGARLTPCEREPCLSSVEFRLNAIRDAREKSERFRAMGITDYMISDECPVGRRCFAPATIKQFRRNLRDAYVSLDELNDEWNTEFQCWDQVEPLAKADMRYPGSYVDFDVFHRWAFAEYCSFLQMLMGDAIPGFKAGQSGGVRGNLMMRYAGALYYYDVIESAVSVKQPDAVIGSWYRPGYRFIEDHETACRAWPWRHLFRGTTRIQLWYPTGGGAPAWHEDLSRPYKAFVWLRQEMNDIKKGIGKLLLHCKRDDGPVAIYSSQRTQFVLHALREIQDEPAGEDKNSASPADRVPPRISQAVRNKLQRSVLGRQVECRFISEYQVEEGELMRRGTKLLLLPRVVSLSSRERAAIRKMLERGGTVVAFGDVGTRNEHGTWVGYEFMREMFGVRPGTVEPTVEEGPKMVSLQGKGERAEKMLPHLMGAGPFQITQGDTVFEADKGDTVALINGAPAIVARTRGPGTAIFMNFTFSKSAFKRGARDAPEAFIQDLLALANVRPVVLVRNKNQERYNLQFGHFRDGDALYAGFLSPGQGGMVEAEKTRQATIKFPQTRYIYDARHGRYLGEDDTVKTTITPSIAHVYAALPWKLTGIEVEPAAKQVRTERTLRVDLKARTEETAPSRQVWQIKIKRPDGRVAKAYARTMLVDGGQSMIDVPIALNAPVGNWTISVRDAATGVEGRAAFEVTAGDDDKKSEK